MRGELFIVTLLGVITAACAQSNEVPLIHLMWPHLPAWMKNLSKENLKLLWENPKATNKEIDCFQACLMTKAGIMNDAKMDIPKIEKVMAESDNPELAKKFVAAVKECQPKSEKSNNGCEVAGNYHRCLKANIS